MRFVPIKSIEQQAVLSLHRVRRGFVKARTAQANQIRGLLGEFGLIIPKGIWHIAQRVPGLLEDASNELPVALRQLIDRLTRHLQELDQQVRELEREILAWHRNSDLSRKLEQIPGIGPLAATALVASIADAKSFDLARTGTSTKLERRKAHLTGDKQTGRRVSTHPADPWSALGHPRGHAAQ